MTTIKDIAKAANVSACTVSRYLNGKIKIKQETGKHIDDAVKSMGYHANPIARSLKTKKTYNIAMIVPALSFDIFSEMADAVNNEIIKYDYYLSLYTTNNEIESEKRIIDRLIINQVDGVLLITQPVGYEGDDAHLKKLQDSKIPFVFVNRIYEECEYPIAYCDAYQGSVLAMEYLLAAKGCTKIGIIIGLCGQPQSEENLRGYKDALAIHGISYDQELIVEARYNMVEAERVAQELIGKGVEAIYAISDAMAIGAYRAAKKLGIKIPEDLAVVGGGDTSLGEMVTPTLTSVNQNVGQLALEATRMLLAMMAGKKVNKAIKLSVKLVKRFSA
ncbi:MAG: LacI family DNA-binding transcriptional regulator [Clostridia bacterium]